MATVCYASANTDLSPGSVFLTQIGDKKTLVILITSGNNK